MTTTHHTSTLSLSDIARLTHVQRPTVTMWRKRAKSGLAFPTPLPDGRFAADDVVDWLEATGRGNSSDLRADLALYTTTSSLTDAERLQDLQVLLTVRVLLDTPLSSQAFDDVLDSVDALDPDDTFLLSEVAGIGPDDYPGLAHEADQLAEAAWNERRAMEHLEDALHRLPTVVSVSSTADRLGEHLRLLQRALAEVAARRGDEVVDTNGAGADALLAASDDEAFDPDVVLVEDLTDRSTLRRYQVHGVAPRFVALDDDWLLSEQSTILLRLPDDPTEAFDLLDTVEAQMPAGGLMLVIGTAETLLDRLPAALVASRDRYLRENLVRAAVCLPQGQTLHSPRTRLALWLLSRPTEEPMGLRIGDLSGHPFRKATAQTLLSDLLAASSPAEARRRAFTHLVPVDRVRILAGGTSLLDSIGIVTSHAQTPAADDAARLLELRAALSLPLPTVLPLTPTGTRDRAPQQAALGQVVDSREAALVPGTRVKGLPAGSTPLWTAASVAVGEPAGVDLVRLVEARPRAPLTQPGDVVFVAGPRPAAIVDHQGGSAVLHPARVLRVRSTRLAPGAIAAAINAVPPGNSAWRSWRVPVVQIDRADADTLLADLDTYESELHRRRTQLAELRGIVDRSVLSGAIKLDTPAAHHHEQSTSAGRSPLPKGRQ